MSVPPTNATGSSFGLSSSVNNVQDETISFMELNDDTLHINSLPDEVFVEIFSYLKVLDLCKIKGVCRRWYILTNCQDLWKHVDAIFPEKFRFKSEAATKLIQMLPTCTTHLKLNFNEECSSKLTEPLNFQELSLMLNERCPNLQSLTLRYAQINICLSSVIDLCASFLQNVYKLRFHFSEFASSGTVEGEIKLAREIKVLDLLGCYVDFSSPLLFKKLPCLKSLNVALSNVLEYELLFDPSVLEELEVLNVEFTWVYSMFFEKLQYHGFHLTTLILCSTWIADDHLKFSISKDAFPHLKTICLDNCMHLSSEGIISLVESCPSLEVAYVRTDLLLCLKCHPDILRKCKHKPHEAEACSVYNYA